MTEPSRDTSKRVFLSYRRDVSQAHSLLLFKELRSRGYDVFYDYSSVGPGKFAEIILNQIATRDHFVLLLTLGTLDRCNYYDDAKNPKAPNPDDWLRREVEHALATGRNIIPLLVDKLSWDLIRPKLLGDMKPLADINGTELHFTHPKMFDTGIEILCSEYLVRTVTETTAEPTPEIEIEAEEIIEASEAETIDEKALEAERLVFSALFDYWDKRYDESIEKLTQIVEQGTENPTVFKSRGDAYYELAQYEKALADYQKAIVLKPDNTAAYLSSGNTNAQLNRFDKAFQDYDRAIQLDSDYSHAFVGRGLAHHNLGRYEEALSDYAQAIQLNPKYATAYNNRGIVYHKTGRLSESIEEYDHAIRLQENATRYANRGEVYFTMGQYLKAQNDFEKSLALQPGYSFALSGLAITYHAFGEITESHALWRQLVAKDERHMDVDWVGKEYDWTEPLIEEARKLIASLKDADD